MFIRVEDIEQSPERKLTVDFKEFIEGIKTKEPVEAKVNFRVVSDRIFAEGKLKATLLMECENCGEEYSYEMEANIKEVFVRHGYIGDIKKETQIKLKDMCEDLFDAEEINLNDLLYQYVIINLPNKNFCGIKCIEEVEKYIRTEE